MRQPDYMRRPGYVEVADQYSRDIEAAGKLARDNLRQLLQRGELSERQYARLAGALSPSPDNEEPER